MRMVDQNGGKFRRLQKILKKSRFDQIAKFFRRNSCLNVYFHIRKKKFSYGHFKPLDDGHLSDVV